MSGPKAVRSDRTCQSTMRPERQLVNMNDGLENDDVEDRSQVNLSRNAAGIDRFSCLPRVRILGKMDR